MTTLAAPTLFDTCPPAPRRFRFEGFHAAHPHVYAAFRRFAGELLAAGWTRGSARMIGERMRWELALAVDRGPGQPRLNDHLWPRYARLLMAEDARFAGFFELRGEAP